MKIDVLHDEYRNTACFMCRTTGTVFGPVQHGLPEGIEHHYDLETAREYLEVYLDVSPEDPRKQTTEELQASLAEFHKSLVATQLCNSCSERIPRDDHRTYCRDCAN